MYNINIGDRFGYLTILQPVKVWKDVVVKWLCRCDCGNEKIVSSRNLTHGFSKSCGKCNFTHQTMRDRFTVWATNEERVLSRRLNDMKKRCYNKRCRAYPAYGGRGIRVCDEWLKDRRKFVEWGLKSGFRIGMSIDRIDVNGPYSPDNCRWCDNDVQANNKTTSRFVDVCGKHLTIAQWCSLLGVRKNTLYQFSTVNNDDADLKWYIVRKFQQMSDEQRALGCLRLNLKYKN